MAKTLHFESDANIAFDAAARLPIPATNTSVLTELLAALCVFFAWRRRNGSTGAQ